MVATLRAGLEIISGEADTASAVNRIADEIENRNDLSSLAVVGIHTGGVVLARRILGVWARRGLKPAATGAVDITLYRDDLEQIGPTPIVHATDVGFDVAGMTVVLVDDVLFTGRTVRAAIDNLMDLGRPRLIQLAVLVDRDGRELPIQADYVGVPVAVGVDEIVEVVFGDNGDSVVKYKRPRSRR